VCISSSVVATVVRVEGRVAGEGGRGEGGDTLGGGIFEAPRPGSASPKLPFMCQKIGNRANHRHCQYRTTQPPPPTVFSVDGGIFGVREKMVEPSSAPP